MHRIVLLEDDLQAAERVAGVDTPGKVGQLDCRI